MWGNASDTHLQQLITTHTQIVRIITFSSYCSHTNILFKHLNVLAFKKLLFLRIGLQMFKYVYGQLQYALNMFLLRIDLCIIPILEIKTNSTLVWNYICENINIATPFASFKRILNKFMFYLILYWFLIDSKTTFNNLINWCRTGNRMHNHIKTYNLYFSCS